MGDNIKLITKNRIDIVIGIEYVDFYENKNIIEDIEDDDSLKDIFIKN